MEARALNALKPNNPVWQVVKQQAVLSQKQTNKCLGVSGDNKLMLQGFSDDLDSIFANLAKNTNANAVVATSSSIAE